MRRWNGFLSIQEKCYPGRKTGLHFMNWAKLPFFTRPSGINTSQLSSTPCLLSLPSFLRETGLLSWDIPNRVDISLVFCGGWENNFILHFKIIIECHTMCLCDMIQSHPVKNSTTAMQKRKGGYLSVVTQVWWLVGCTEPLFTGT